MKVKNLPDEYKQVVLLEQQGISFKEIANRLELPLGVVIVRLSRGRALLNSPLASQAEPASRASSPEPSESPIPQD